MGYLTDDEREELRVAIGTLVNNDYFDARPALLSNVPGEVKAIMARAQLPVTQLIGDIEKLDRVERMSDGRIPLLIMLKLVIAAFGAADATAAATVREIMAKVDRAASGAPPVAPPAPAEIAEAIVHQNDMVPLAFLRLGLAAGAAVAKLAVPRFDNDVQARLAGGAPMLFLGTGWLIAKGVLVTNHHVINARLLGQPKATDDDFKAQALATIVTFDFDEEPGPAGETAAVLELIAHNSALDYAVLRVASGERLPLVTSDDLPVPPVGHGAAALNVIQHPGGQPKKFAIRNNLSSGATDKDLRYFSDTDGGSSGSPVLDDGWRVVALHRGSTTAPQIFQGRAAAQINVGTRISAILADLRDAARNRLPELNI